MNELQAKAGIQISRPIATVFQAIVDPNEMSNYFIETGTGKLEAGNTVTWKFPEFADKIPVKVLTVHAPVSIIFEWEGAPGNQLKVDIQLEDRGGNSTVVKVTEGDMPNTDAGLKWLRGNTEGWANFLACMKAWLEYGIHLRKGAFDYMKPA
ncbi:MAG: SRPBCC domain-containing protein [Chitinophaga sp.]|uniref:SRPBCC domain-containing protein n=1 Tax=Chitinophaga sp. TaxID=1869181 RepID=UPI0025BB9945|nr:SRPBCC domain-containing protein [Chitinophaga sp.]MBV8251288.1 SRPBCC domain-containing protein [Chitinophaga sp.]